MENTQRIYENLLVQYDNLSDLEKNAILIYKSKLFVVINSITKIKEYEKLTSLQISEQLPNKEECISIFNSYSKILDDLKNIFIKNTVFGNVRFDNFNNFLDDLKLVINILNKISFKMVLEEDIVVYRSILVNKNKEFDFINDSSSLISTSIKVEDAEKFLDVDITKEKHFYSLKLTKGIPVIVSPFSVVRKYDSFIDSIQNNDVYSLGISNRGINGQQEIILFRDYVFYKELNNKVVADEEFDSVFIHFIEIYPKENINFDHNTKSK